MYGKSEVRVKDGRLAVLSKPVRMAHANRRWGFFNRIYVQWIAEDGTPIGTPEPMALGKFNTDCQPVATGQRRVFDAGVKRYV